MNPRRMIAVIAALAVALGAAACGSSSGGSTGTSGGSSTAAGGSTNASSSGKVGALVGAGSTLVTPLIEQWQKPYLADHNVAVTYGSIGSGGGIEQITARSVDFGASDAPLTSQQASACKNCLEIPWALAATTVAYNVKGVSSGLHLTGPVIADIYLGKITMWNDPQIKALNPGVNLPALKITPVYRSDGSGDTFAFTNYLAKISPEFKSKVGNATSVSWPTGVGGKGNSGVGGVVSSTNGAIGYIAIAYVVQNKFDYALVQNAAGKYPTPNVKSISAAAAAVNKIPTGGMEGVSLTDPPASAAGAYPISTFTYILVPKQSKSPGVASALKDFISWAITAGQKYGPPLDFAPLPSGVVNADKADLALIK